MDLGGLLVLGLMWLVVNAIRKAGAGAPTEKRPPDAPRPPLPGARTPVKRPAARSTAPSTADATATRLPVPLDPTQREGARLEQLLRQLGRSLEEAAGPGGRPPDRPLPPAEEEEERESLEAIPEVQSLEIDPARAPRVEVDQDDEAERVVARRLRVADANLAPRTRADHRAFDARIRQEAADQTAVASSRTQRLRQAVVWREILGPPVSLRDDEER